MVEVIDKLAPECTIKPPHNNKSWKIKYIVFVDVKGNYVNLLLKNIKESPEEATEKLISMWDKLLYFIGGKFEIVKYEYWILEWTFDKGEKPQLK